MKTSGKCRTLITGGCGFIGTNLAARLLSKGKSVLLFDNLSRQGVKRNWEWLKRSFGTRVQMQAGDMRDARAVKRVVDCTSEVFHLAAQVAVTSSIDAPVQDFETNTRGTLNLLEAIRAQKTPPALVFTSTNKVYGSLNDIPLQSGSTRYEPQDGFAQAAGISELRPLDFHSPYGCSKGAADQYILDYSRTYGLPTIVFRMSCIYGPHQFGNEDQGWVAHFLISALQKKKITLYGDGKQVRDILFVDDLVEALLAARDNSDRLAGKAFNIGGGRRNAVSLIELIKLIGELRGEPVEVSFSDWRVGDQRYYVSDISKFSDATGWTPTIGMRQGVKRLYDWLVHSEQRVSRMLPPPRRRRKVETVGMIRGAAS